MEFTMQGIDYGATEYEVVKKIAEVLHSEEFYNPDDPKARPMNMRVKLDRSQLLGFRHDGSGRLTLPTRKEGERFKTWYRTEGNSIKVNDRKIRFHSAGRPGKDFAEMLRKVPYIDPDIEEARKDKIDQLSEALRVNHVQFGVLYFPPIHSSAIAPAAAAPAPHAVNSPRPGASSSPPWARGNAPSVRGRGSSRGHFPGPPQVRVVNGRGSNKRRGNAPAPAAPPVQEPAPPPAPAAPSPRKDNRNFSVECDRDCTSSNAAWLSINYMYQVLRLQMGDPVTSEMRYSIVIKFASINGIAIGLDFGNPYIVFDLHTPVILEQEDFHRPLTGDEREDNKKFRERLISLDNAHARVAPYASSLRLVMVEWEDVMKFQRLCGVAGIPSPRQAIVPAQQARFYSADNLRLIEQWLRQIDWATAFQIEVLLHNSLVNTGELLGELAGPIRTLYQKDPVLTADLLRSLVEALQSPTRIRGESALECFNRVQKEKEGKTPLETPPGNFHCCHVTFTPTRMILEGPYVTQSNRVIRRYTSHQHHFVRVDFRDEDRLQYRWDREVDGRSFLHARVGQILKDGFALAGRPFEFLAYSSSALREHSVWFVNPFEHDAEGWVTADAIRQTLGDFSGVARQPAKYAARMAQAFTATDPSVRISPDEWDEMPDLGEAPYEHTDGVGTISLQLADQIWDKLCEDRQDLRMRNVKPSSYQIRFLGYKGMVSVDDQLEGIKMRLRPSMNKFRAHETDEDAEIEIARAFYQPMACNLNRSLIMILEDRGVPRDVFLKLQNEAVAEIHLSRDQIDRFRRVIKDQGLGTAYGLSHIVDGIKGLGLDFSELDPQKYVDSIFLHRLVTFATHHALRDIKHGARIPIKEGWLLPGVADEGQAYVLNDYPDVFTLEADRIFACIQGPYDEEPMWLKGSCLVWRSPAVHPGDVQRVFAIGKPPDDKLCLFRNLKNVLVLPSVGERSLASKLGGGDVDGDLFCICKDPSLLPSEHEEPAAYDAAKPILLPKGQSATIEDVCNFVVDYIHSDVLGLLSDRHLMIADQSKEGVRDADCIAIAELCGLAVDYPKSGVAVDIRRSPRLLLRYKPDWHAAEVVNPRKIDYYESIRALGYLYRAFDLPKLQYQNKEVPATLGDNMSDNLSRTLLRDIHRFLPLQPINETPAWLNSLFQRYLNELRYICTTHTLGITSFDQLIEEEVVIGTILAACSQTRWRKDRMYRMRLHSAVLVRNTAKHLLESPKEQDRAELLAGLERGWTAWCFSVRYSPSFGANSFGFIALRVMFQAIEALDCLV